jgi:hypothetical protein
MNKLTLLVLGLGVMLVGATPASAFSLANNYQGPLKFKFVDFSDGQLYQSSSGGYGNADNTEDAWGIFKVTSIQSDDGFNTTLWFDGKDGEELTGIYYGLDDDFWTIDDDGGLNIQSVGAKIDMYLDSGTLFNASPGPGARVGNTYPAVTDGSLFLTADFAPGIKYGDGNPGNDHIAYDNNLDGTTSPFTGDGAFYLDVTGGSYAYLFNSDRWNLTDDSGNTVARDFFGKFDTEAPGPFGWLVESDDPISGAAIPEPATMALLGSGLFGMVGSKLRKKRA